MGAVPTAADALRRSAAIAATAAVVLLGALGLAGCGGSDGGPETTGPTTQAVEKLADFGLSTEEATCIVDHVGAESVVEATDLNAYTEGQEYRDAAKECIADG